MKIYKESIIFYTCTVILHVLIVYVKCDWLIDCGECRCKWNSGKKTADCKNLTLSTIPKNLSSELQVLDLSYNNIYQLNNNAFINADLTNLHKLFMRNCNLKNIQTDAFKGLEILIEIDLSNNLLKNLSYNIFIHLVKVRSIVLNNNKIEILQNGLFCNLKYLHKIELKNNKIHLIEINVFNNLPYLSQIFLNDNKLKFLRKEIFENLKRLASLSLDSNPWNCTCELQSFRDFVLKYNLYTPPTSCYYPIKLRGILWTDQNQPEAFACKPKILYPSRGASINTSKENVTLICRVHASPNTLIAWDYNKQMYSNNYQQARVHIQLLREELHSDDMNTNNKDNKDSDKDKTKDNIDKEIGRDIFISRLTIIGAEKSDEGTYTCFAENPGGKDEVQMNLLVQKHTHQNLLFHNNLVIVICLMVLGLLSASIFLAMITCCIYKRFKAINQLPNSESNDSHLHRHHHSHLHDQKQNYVNGLNVVNDSYHRHNHNYHQQNGGETNYTSDIKQNGNLSDVSVTIKNFTELNDTNNLYRENSSQGSLQKHQQGYDDYLQYEQQQQKQQQNQKIYQDNEQIQSTTSSKIHTPIPSERHYSSEQLSYHGNGEYQPDLLPYIPQSISLGYAVNQVLSSSYDGKQLLDHKQYPYHNLEHLEQQEQQQQIRHHKEDQTIDDLQYVHSYVGETFNNAVSKYEGNAIRNRNCNNTFISDEYLHNGIGNIIDGTRSSIDNILMPVGKKIINPSTMISPSTSTLVTYPTMNHHHHHHPDKQIFQRVDDDDGAIKIYPDDLDSSTATTTSTSSEIFLRRHPVVRNSSSLNFIYNLNDRREIL